MRRPGFRDGYLVTQLHAVRMTAPFREARVVIGAHLHERTWEELRPLFDPEHAQHALLFDLVAHWELAASLVLRGILHPEVYVDACDEGLFLYATLEEHLPRARELRPSFLTKTEAVVQQEPRVKGRLIELRGRLFRLRQRRQA